MARRVEWEAGSGAGGDRVGTAELGAPGVAAGGSGSSGLAAAYERHGGELAGFAARLVGPDEAADVVATAMARIVRGGHWQGIRNPRAFLYRAVYREAVSSRRQFARRAGLVERLAATGDAGDRHAPPPGEPVDAAVLAAVAALPVRQRAVVVLAYWRDQRPEDIADHLGISPGAVRKHLARARAALREALA